MTSAESAVLFVGALTHDTLYRVNDFSKGPGKHLASGIVTASGMAATAATAAARLGGKSALCASVGSDAKAQALIDEIASEGVDCTNVRRVSGGRSASATIIVDEIGERWVVVDYDPVTQASPEATSMPPIEPFAAVMADVRWPGAAKLMLTAARESGRLAILDADVASVEVLQELAPCATHIVASDSGAQILSGKEDPKQAAHHIAARYGCFVCVTQGEAGSVWTAPGSDEICHIPSPQVSAIDTNGAGDVFHGAFAQALVEGQSSNQAIQFASAAAALKCTVLGGRMGAPDRKTTLELMNETYE